jgi:hypothetical protein
VAKNISLILHRFKDVRTSILTLIFGSLERLTRKLRKTWGR